MLWKSKILAGVVWLLLTIAALVVILLLPAMYKSEALILVDSQKIPEKYVSATVNADVQDRLATINQRILSGTRLKKIIDDLQLYREEQKSDTEEEILDKMRKDTEVKLERGWTGNRPGAFRIAYRAPVPALAADVANRLASLYIEENLLTREVQAEGTSEFLETQLQAAKKRLDDLERALSGYKLRHNGELPEQEGSLTGALSRLHTELQGVQDATNRAQQNRLMLDHTLSLAEAAEAASARVVPPTAASAVAAPEPAAPSAPKKSEVVAEQLEGMRLRYSDAHPDVKRLASELVKLRSQEQQEAAGKPDSKTVKAPAAQQGRAESEELARARQRTEATKAQIALAERELQARGADRRRILGEIAAHEARLARLPVREQEMSALTRDYEISRTNYKSLLEKKLAAEMATEMERRQKGERFTLLDPARIPEKPFRPNRVLLGSIACPLALLVSIVLAVGREAKKGLVLGEWELPEHIPVLGRVPRFGSATAGRRWLWRRRRPSLRNPVGEGAE